MKTRMTTLALAVGLWLTAVPAGAGQIAPVPRDYLESVEDTIADNQAQGPSNVSVARNIVCAILPFDAYQSYYPAFYAAGSGAAGRDTASFNAACYSPSFSRAFTLDVTYSFQYYRGRGSWVDLGTAFRCSTGSTAVGDQRIASVQIPGTPRCAFQQVYREGDPSLTRPHRLQVELNVTGDDRGQGPHIKGWSIPWPMTP